MKTIHKTALICRRAELVFQLVDDVEAYPEFLPWCRASRVLRREGEVVEAELEIAWGRFCQVFATRNFNRPGREIRMTLLHGPFSYLEGIWRFQPLAENASKVTLDLAFEVAFGLQSLAFGVAFDRICDTLVEAFATRARSLYG